VSEVGVRLQDVDAGGLGGLEVEGQMHALVAAVLRRMAWLDGLDLDAEPQPPDRELGEVEEGVRAGKRHAIIGADGLGEAVFLEDGLEHLEGISFLGGGERIVGEDVAAVGSGGWGSEEY